MFGNQKQAKSPQAAISFLSGKKHSPVAEAAPDMSASPDAMDDGSSDGDLKSQIDALIDQYGAEAVQTQIDQCVQEEQGGTETDTDSGTDLPAIDPRQG